MSGFILGLTGSIGMGKSTTAAVFRAAGVPVWDADAAVHRLYAAQGPAVAPVGALCPDAVKDGTVDRLALKVWLQADPNALAQLEAVVHPLVARDRADFIAQNQGQLIVLDIPLLFEKDGDRGCDATLLVTTSPEIQRARVLSRPGMTQAQLDFILSKQLPDAEKRARATHIVETLTPEQTKVYVLALIDNIRARCTEADDA